MQLEPGSITDIAGLRVGHAQAAGRPTGCTVVLCPPGTVGGVAVRGGSPGTRETDLLRPENTVDVVHAVLLTGGSAFGLDAASGVMRWLDEQGIGLPVGPGVRVPIVPAAVLFDLWVGDARIRPDADTGYTACQAATTQPPAQGSAGAGAGAMVGKLLGVAQAMRGGIGTASLHVGGCTGGGEGGDEGENAGRITVSALVAVNAIGDVLDAQGRIVAGARTADGTGFADSTAAMLAGHMARRPAVVPAGSATTIGIVATDAALTKTQATQLAQLAHHGLSRAISPVTAFDGDTLFALGTGSVKASVDISALGAMAAEAVARAIRNAVCAAQPLPPAPGQPALPSVSSMNRNNSNNR